MAFVRIRKVRRIFQSTKPGSEKNMADFETKSTTKSAVRKLAEPLADVTAFDNLVQGVITNNPFQCTT
jgi:transcription termination factor NusB